MPDKPVKPNSGKSPAIPENIAHYRILQRLGKGGMGEVFLGEDTRQHNRRVALKILPPELLLEERRVRRFRQEARAVLALNHPNIITIYEIGEASNSYYIASEFIEGETLRQRLSQQQLTIDEVLGIGIQVAMALESAHAAGIVHRDIKPENIMLREDGFARDRFVKVLDFGLAKLTEPDVFAADPEAVTIPITATSPGAVIGTSGYMSPEQAQGDTIDSRSDIFSLGVVLYEMVAGEPPFKGPTDSHTLVSIIDHEAPPLAQKAPDVPRQLERIVAKALAKDRLKRYQTVTDLKLDLEQLRDELHLESSTGAGTRSESDTVADTSVIRPTPTTTRAQVETITDAPAPVPTIASAAVPKHSKWNLYATFGVVALALVVAAIVYFTRPGPAINSVAVLPFVNDSHDPNVDYLSDGITESIINSLSQLPELKVMSRNAAFRFKGANVDPLDAGRNLNVGAVLTGRLMKLNDRFVIKTELIKVADGSQLWGDEYNSSLADIFSVQNEVSKKITQNLRLRLSGADEQKLEKRYTHDAQAYQLYLKGRYFWNKRNE